jgi:enolase
MPIIEKLSALEILDSRGRPTVKAWCTLKSGITGAASIPSGASTGKAEAHELRDDEERFNGLGCKKAVHNIETRINAHFQGKEITDQAHFDRELLDLDQTPNKSELGANATLAVSIAFARSCAQENKLPLYRHFSEMAKIELKHIPRPTINLYSGGKHAGGQVPVQDLLVVPGHPKLPEVYDTTFRLYYASADHFAKKYNVRSLSADEGGLAPPFNSQQDMFDDAMEILNTYGSSQGEPVSIALDVASSHFYQEGKYHIDHSSLNSREMIQLIDNWITEYPIISIEDGLDEEDWENWPGLLNTLKGRSLVMGDDFLCTNPGRIRKAIEKKAANALLLKVNQIGTLSEALQACKLAREADWSVTISARSGETEDDWLADLATGWQADFIKVGSITQSERLAKYNRLLEIEQETGLEVIPLSQVV